MTSSRVILSVVSALFVFAACTPATEESAPSQSAANSPVSGSAAAITRSEPPELNLDYDRFQLDNGLTVVVHEDRKAPVVAASIWYHVGSKNEPAGQTGFAHLFEHLMFNGTENYDGEWFEPLQRVGGTTLNGTTWLDRTNYYQTVPTPAVDLVLWMESDRMGHLLGAVTQTKLDNQRGVVQNEKRQGDNQPYGRVYYNMMEGLFPPEHPYHHPTIGSMEDLDAASLEDVQEWFRSYYGPNNAVLAIVGDIDVETAREKVERYFGDIPAGPNVDAFDAWMPVREHSTREIQYDEVPGVLAVRAWAVPGRNTREHALLNIVAAVLGQGRNSRLYRDLLYDRQLATSVEVTIAPFELAAVVDLEVRLNPGVAASVASESIDRIIAELIESGPTDEELERVISSINASTVRSLEQVNGKASVLAEGELYAGDPLFIVQYLDWINSATPEAVREVARQYLGDGWHQVDVVPNPDYLTSSEGVDRSGGLPELPTESPTLIFPDIQTTTLSNGVEIILAERHAVPLVAMAAEFDAGYAADFGGKLGVASFAMSMLDRGTASRGLLEIAAEAERLGANIDADSDLDSSEVRLNALANRLPESIALWADVIRNPEFDQEEIDRLRENWIASIAQEKAEPEGLALRLLPPALYGDDHPYGVPFTGSGTAESINAITRDDLLGFQQQWIRPDNVKIFIAGDTTLGEIVPLLEDALVGWSPSDSALVDKNISSVAPPAGSRVILIDKPGSAQSVILAGHVAPGLGTERDLTIQAMNDVLGGQFTARINMNLREDKGWSYGARTTLIDAIGQRPYLVSAPVQTDRTGDSLIELMRELNAIQNEQPITPDEMARVISAATRGLPGRFQTVNSVLSSLISSARYGRPLDYPATLTERFEALQLPELQAAANEVVLPDQLTWIVVGDLALIREQVEATGLGPVEIWNDDGQRLE